MTVEIRPATAADAGALAGLEAACFADAWSESSIAAALAVPTGRAWLATADGEQVGYLLGLLVADEFSVYRVATLPTHRQMGLGRALMENALQEAQNQGATKAFLEVRADNQPAIGLYLSMGFVQTRRRKRYYENGEDALDFQKTLE